MKLICLIFFILAVVADTTNTTNTTNSTISSEKFTEYDQVIITGAVMIGLLIVSMTCGWCCIMIGRRCNRQISNEVYA